MAQRSAVSARNTSPEISAPLGSWRHPEQFANVPQWSSFVAQGHQGIDSRSASGGDDAAKRDGGRQHDHDANEGRGIVGRDADQCNAQETGGGQGKKQANS